MSSHQWELEQTLCVTFVALGHHACKSLFPSDQCSSQVFPVHKLNPPPRSTCTGSVCSIPLCIWTCLTSLFSHYCSLTAITLFCSDFAIILYSQLTSCLTSALVWADCNVTLSTGYPCAAWGFIQDSLYTHNMKQGAQNCAVMSITPHSLGFGGTNSP